MHKWTRPTPARKRAGNVADKGVAEAEGGAFSYWLQWKRTTPKRSERGAWVE